VEQLAQRNPIKVLGFVEDVADLLRSADVVVTKAGGVTLAEAFCCGVPVVVHDAVPGQETGNLEYVLQQGASRYAERPDDLVQIMRELLVDPTKRAELAQRGVMLARPDAARRIAENVLARLV
jgi:UDP-N-acetylglucosamine:LPS N-acetylglucosamine transferase